ncbi:MAG: helix-turn-helix domain-containing protein [Gammaproteobacteria bacterium]|nr:helix-turn-helix domain-containing protein [Gammaproteobacteria bacterium]
MTNNPTYLKSQLEKLLTPQEAAHILGISAGTLEVWRSTGRYDLRYIKVGRRVMYRAQDVQAFIEKRSMSHTQ